jgi:uroporphyrinogen decarboxylase
MESRKRVLDALNHKQPDRVPVDLGSHRSSNFSVHAYKKLREYLGLKPDTLYLYDLIQQLIIPGDDVLDMFGSDVVALGRDFRDDPGYWKDWVMQDGTEIKIPAFVDFRKEGGDSWLYNVNGKRIGVQKSGCLYVEQLVFPRRGDDSEDFSNLEEQFHDVMWFEVGAPPAPLGYEGDDLLKRKETAKSLRAGTTGAIYGLFGGTFFEGCQWIFSMEDAFIHMAADKKLMKNYLDKMLEIHKKNLEYYLDACGDELDVLGFSDDLGMQTGPQISPEMYKEMFKPYHK